MKKRRIRSRLWLDECGAGAAFFVGTTCRKEAASRGIYPLELLSLPKACYTRFAISSGHLGAFSGISI
jgi:hypothetical protein